MRAPLEQLVSELPEVYQPIYNNPHLNSSRAVDDPRISIILEIAEKLSAHLDRPLRILDLGSAQGYISFCLAEQGHHVTGIDYLDKNVDIAQAIQEQNPNLDVSFLCSDISLCESIVDLSSYDLVVALSIFHHLIYRDGSETVGKFMATLSERIPHALFEMALREEGQATSNVDLYWADSLPEDPRITLAPYPFIRELGTSPTHLTNVARPTFFCSRDVAYVNGDIKRFTNWSESPHQFADSNYVGTRRYFFFDDIIVKTAARYSESVSPELVKSIRDELCNASSSYEKLISTGINIPPAIEFHESEHETLLAIAIWPGETLDAIYTQLNGNDRKIIMSSVLQQLADLEQKGFYHGDIRLWNVVWDAASQQAHLIDIGAIDNVPTDALWPNDNYFAFTSFVFDLWAAESKDAQYVGGSSILKQVRQLMIANMLHDRNDHVYRDLCEQWENQNVEQSEASEPQVIDGWFEFFQQLRGDLLLTMRSNHRAIDMYNELLVQAREQLIQLEGQRKEIEHLTQNSVAVQQQLQSAVDEIDRMRQTWGWRITAPLRALHRLFR